MRMKFKQDWGPHHKGDIVDGITIGASIEYLARKVAVVVDASGRIVKTPTKMARRQVTKRAEV